jgi:hypothetical protein
MADVFNEGLLLSTIIDFLSIEDTCKLLYISILHETIYLCIEEKKRQKDAVLVVAIYDLMDKFTVAPFGERVRKLDAIFEHLLLNRWFLKRKRWAKFEKAIEQKLFHFADPYSGYHFQALYYLEELFDIRVKADTFHEYLQNRDGDTLFLSVH